MRKADANAGLVRYSFSPKDQAWAWRLVASRFGAGGEVERQLGVPGAGLFGDGAMRGGPFLGRTTQVKAIIRFHLAHSPR